jgi:acyl carrier protein
LFAHCFVQDALPLTSNGKINRASLPAPKRDDMLADSSSFQPPRNETEKLIAASVCSLLALDRVSMLDNFFDVGGHSLLAHQLVTRIRQMFGVELPISRLFNSNSLRELATSVQSLLSSDFQPSSEAQDLLKTFASAFEEAKTSSSSSQQQTTVEIVRNSTPDLVREQIDRAKVQQSLQSLKLEAIIQELPMVVENQQYPLSYNQRSMLFMHKLDPKGKLVFPFLD